MLIILVVSRSCSGTVLTLGFNASTFHSANEKPFEIIGYDTKPLFRGPGKMIFRQAGLHLRPETSPL